MPEHGDWLYAESRCICGGPACFERIIGACQFLRADDKGWQVYTADHLYLTIDPKDARPLADSEPKVCLSGARAYAAKAQGAGRAAYLWAAARPSAQERGWGQ